MTWPERLLNDVTLVALVLVAVAAAFYADPTASFRTRRWKIRRQWLWAVRDTTTTVTAAGCTMTVISTRLAALRLLTDVMGDLLDG